MTQHTLEGRTEQEVLWVQRRSFLQAAAAWSAMGGLAGALHSLAAALHRLAAALRAFTCLLAALAQQVVRLRQEAA